MESPGSRRGFFFILRAGISGALESSRVEPGRGYQDIKGVMIVTDNQELEQARRELAELRAERDLLAERRRPRRTLGNPTPDQTLEVLTDDEEARLQELLEELIPEAAQKVERLKQELEA